MPEEQILSVAERHYNGHKARVTKFQKANPEKMKVKCKAYNERIKEERPERYQEILEEKRKYYHEVTKPKNEAKKKALEGGAKPPSLPKN